MNFVIPMAGRGQRFVDSGYSKPKMLIEARGKTLLEWSVDSLPLELSTKLIFILLKEHEEKHQLTAYIRSKYSKYELDFLILEDVTRGQAETVYMAKEKMNSEIDLLIFNIDTYFHSDTLSDALEKDTDGILGCFVDKTESNRYSYAEIDELGVVVNVAEKVHISDYALTGLYHFRKASDFLRIAENHLKKNKTVKGEFYIAPMYNDLIEEGKRFHLDLCQDYAILGTPEELEVFRTSKE